MHEDDPVALALRGIGRRHEEAHPEAHNAERGRRDPEPRLQFPGNGIEAGGTRQLEPIHEAVAHSNAILNAAVGSHGAKTQRPRSSKTASRVRWPPAPGPGLWACTAPALE